MTTVGIANPCSRKFRLAPVFLPLFLLSSLAFGLPESRSQDHLETVAIDENENREDDFAIPEGFESGFVWSGDRHRFRLWGNASDLAVVNDLDDDSLLNPGNIDEIADWRNEAEIRLKLDGSVAERFQVFARQRFSFAVEEIEEETETDTDAETDQLYGTWQFGTDPALVFFSAGKQRIKWGTAFAWNPVDTFNPRQDLKDDQRTEEGRVGYRADVATPSLTFTGVFVPDIDSRNLGLENFGPEGDSSLFACRLYTFLWNTDLAAYLSCEEHREPRFGASFSTVIGDIQFFGEAVHWNGESERQYVTAGSEVFSFVDPLTGAVREYPIPFGIDRKDRDFFRVAAGFQYTFSDDITVIGEYFHNGDGYDESDMDRYVDFLTYAGDGYSEDFARYGALKKLFPELVLPDLPSPESLLQAGNGLYRFAELRKNYLHLSIDASRVSSRFDLGLDAIAGLDDFLDEGNASMFMRLRAAYVGIQNWRFSVYTQHYIGPPDTEFGMFPVDCSVFGQVRYFF